MSAKHIFRDQLDDFAEESKERRRTFIQSLLKVIRYSAMRPGAKERQRRSTRLDLGQIMTDFEMKNSISFDSFSDSVSSALYLGAHAWMPAETIAEIIALFYEYTDGPDAYYGSANSDIERMTSHLPGGYNFHFINRPTQMLVRDYMDARLDLVNAFSYTLDFPKASSVLEIASEANAIGVALNAGQKKITLYFEDETDECLARIRYPEIA